MDIPRSALIITIFWLIGGIVIMLGSAYDWKWYWNWGGNYNEEDHLYQQCYHFFWGAIMAGAGFFTIIASYTSIGLVLLIIFSVIFTTLIAKLIDKLSGANLIVGLMGARRKRKSKNDIEANQ